MKKKWIFIPMVVVLTTILLVSGVVFAQENSDVEKIKQTFTGRVAVILGLEEKVVQDAFDQARKQIEDERIAEIQVNPKTMCSTLFPVRRMIPRARRISKPW